MARSGRISSAVNGGYSRGAVGASTAGGSFYKKNSPSPTITAGPVRKASLSMRRSSGPAGVSTRTGDCAMPRVTAAAAAPVDPVPELFVSPAPRS